MGFLIFKVLTLFFSASGMCRGFWYKKHTCVLVPNKLCSSPVQEGCRGGEMQGCYIPSEEASLSSSCTMSSSMKLQRTMSSRYRPAVPLSALLHYYFKQAFLLGANILFPGSLSPWVLKCLWKQSSVGWKSMFACLIFRQKPSPWLKFIFSNS